MDIQLLSSDDGTNMTYKICGRFVYESQSTMLVDLLRGMDTSLSSLLTTYTVDLKSCEIMDSSAIGCLLILSQHASIHNSELVIICTSDSEIHKMVMTAKLDSFAEVRSE